MRLVLALICSLFLAASSFGQIVSSNVWYGNGADAFWPTAANWSNSVVPTSGTFVSLTNFGVAGVRGTNGSGVYVTPNIIISNDTRIAMLYVNNTNSVLGAANTMYHTLLISNGVTLTVSNSATATGFLNTNAILQVASQSGAGGGSAVGGQDYGNNAQTYFTVVGSGGTLVVNSTNGIGTGFSRGNIFVGQGTLGLSLAPTIDPMNAILDMSALDNFICDANHILIGDGGANPYFFNRPAGTIYFAKTNIIRLATVGTGSSGAGSPAGGLIAGCIVQNNGGGLTRIGKFFLGLTNSIYNNGGINLASRGASGWLGFNPSNAPGTSTAYFRDRAGTGRETTWSVGNRLTVGNGVSDVFGELDFSLGTVDALVGTLGIAVNGIAAVTQATIGTVGFGAGTIDVNTLQLGVQTGNSTGPVRGTLSVSNTAVLKVNTSGTFGGPLGSPGANFYARLNITDGGQVLFGNTAPLNIGVGSSTEIKLLNGSKLAAFTIGSPSTPLTSLQISNSTLTIDRGVLSNPGAAPVSVDSLDASETNTVNVLGTVLVAGRFPLIKYNTLLNGGFTNFVLGSTSPGVTAYLTNNLANSSIDVVVVSSITTLLSWDGQTNGVDAGNWDIGITTNWQGGLAYSQAAIPGSLVQFDDTAAGTTTINITNLNLSPAIINVTNDTKTYTFGGTGGIVGPGNLTKSGVGTLILANSGSNGFTGGVSINQGTLRISGSPNRIPSNSIVVLQDEATATFDLNNLDQILSGISGGGSLGGNITLGTGTLTIRGGSGSYGGIISGAGALIKNTSGTQTLSGANTYSGGTIVSNSALLVLNSTGSGLGSGPVVIATNGTIQLGNGSSDGSVSYPIITNNGTLSLNPPSSTVLANVVVGTGNMLKLLGSGSTLYVTNANPFTGASSVQQGLLQISHTNALGGGSVTVGNATGTDTKLVLTGGIIFTNPITLSGKTGAIIPSAQGLDTDIDYNSGLPTTNTTTGNITLTGSTCYGVGASAGKLIVAGNIVNSSTASGSGAQFFLRGAALGEFRGSMNQGVGAALNIDKRDGGTWILSGTNTYSGYTAITEGKVVLNGAIQGSSSLTLKYSFTYPTSLAGVGRTTAAVTNIGTIYPGDDGVIGTLTISNLLECDGAGTVVFDVNTNGNDQIRGLTQVNYAGTLQVKTNGTLTGPCVFKLFSAASYSGSFTTYALDDITPLGMDWDTSYLTVDGTLHATNGTVVTPVITTATRSGNQFVLGGTGTLVAPFNILAATNLNIPLGSWDNLGEGTIANGVFSFTDTTAGNYPVRFYRLVTPTP